MNYLAHLYLSDPTPLAWAGSLMGDFVKGRDLSGYPRELERHLRLHRHIDAYTAGSAAFQASRRRLDERFRHGRAVLVDVFYDHLLACCWSDYARQPLKDFSREVYRGLESCSELLSPPLRQMLPRMVAEDWLSGYRRPETVARVLGCLEQRLQGKVPLASGYPELARLHNALIEDFRRFMEEVEPLVRVWKQHN